MYSSKSSHNTCCTQNHGYNRENVGHQEQEDEHSVGNWAISKFNDFESSMSVANEIINKYSE